MFVCCCCFLFCHSSPEIRRTRVTVHPSSLGTSQVLPLHPNRPLTPPQALLSRSNGPPRYGRPTRTLFLHSSTRVPSGSIRKFVVRRTKEVGGERRTRGVDPTTVPPTEKVNRRKDVEVDGFRVPKYLQSFTPPHPLTPTPSASDTETNKVSR